MFKYIDIERLKDKYATVFKAGEHIVCQEKVDGANASIAFGAGGILKAFSRRRELDFQNTLEGFYNFVQSIDPKKFSAVLGDRFIIFGEWLCAHTVRYPADKMKQFYVFDIFDTYTDRYLPWSDTRSFAGLLGLKTVPIFYDGEFTTWEDVLKLVGKTEMGASPCGEGIVVKSQDRLNNQFSGTPAYVKIVAKEFSEVHKSKSQKEIDPIKIAAKQAAQELASSIVTERRVVKILEKFIEDGRIPRDWDEKNFGAIAKILPRAVYEDCVKEEPEIVAQIEDFGKVCAKIAMSHARGFVK